MAVIDRDQLGGAAGSAFASWWTDCYTRGLPTDVRERRVAEIASDVHDHARSVETGRVRGAGLEIGWRAVRGIPADLSWRRLERRTMRNGTRATNGTPLHNAWAVVTQTWFAPIAVLVGLFDLLASVAVIADENGKMPGQVIGPVMMTVLALGLFTGLWLRWRAGRAVETRGHSGQAAGIGSVRQILAVVVLVLAVALLVVGASTGTATVYFSALGVLGTALVVLGGTALVRAIRSTNPSARVGLADALIVVGTLPALAFFWMIIPAVLALAVIGGVLGTSPRLRTA